MACQTRSTRARTCLRDANASRRERERESSDLCENKRRGRKKRNNSLLSTSLKTSEQKHTTKENIHQTNTEEKIFNNIISIYYILHLQVVAIHRQGIFARAPCLTFGVSVPSSFARGTMLDSANECLHVGLQKTPEHVSTNFTLESLNTHHAKAVW